MTLETTRTRIGIEYAADQHIDTGDADDGKIRNKKIETEQKLRNFHKNNAMCNVKRSATELNS